MKTRLPLAATLIVAVLVTTLFAQQELPLAPQQAPMAPPADDAVVLTVDGTPITQGDVREVFMARFARQFQQMPPEQAQALMPQVQQMVMSSLISKTLLLNEAKEKGYEANEEEVEKGIQEIASSLPGEATIEEFAASAGIDLERIRGQISEDLRIRQLIDEVTADVESPAENDLKQYYAEHPDEFQQSESVEASHILLSTRGIEDETEVAAKKAEAEKLRKQLVDGEGEFADLAQAHSDCPSKAQGGSLGQFGSGQMVPAFEKAAFSQEVGAIGEVVETDFGYHIIQVTKKNEAKTVPYEEVKEQLSERLLQAAKDEHMQSYIGTLRESAKIEQPGAAEAGDEPAESNPAEAGSEEKPAEVP